MRFLVDRPVSMERRVHAVRPGRSARCPPVEIRCRCSGLLVRLVPVAWLRLHCAAAGTALPDGDRRAGKLTSP
ncbi:MAG: hypothetical protein ABI699_11225 [Caldimonas sp.]